MTISLALPVIVAIIGAVVHLIGGKPSSLGLVAFGCGLLVALQHAG